MKIKYVLILGFLFVCFQNLESKQIKKDLVNDSSITVSSKDSILSKPNIHQFEITMKSKVDKKSKVELSVIISFAALLISFFTVWFNVLKPFNPKLSVGTIYLIPNIEKVNETQSALKLSIGLPIEFFNAGAKAGLIEDFAVKMEKVDNEGFIGFFYPLYFYSNQELIDNRLKKNPDWLSSKGLYSNIFLASKEKLYKEILFGLDKSNQKKFTDGDYKFTIYIKFQNKEFKEYLTRIEKINSQTITEIETGVIQGLMPFAYRDDFTKNNFK